MTRAAYQTPIEPKLDTARILLVDGERYSVAGSRGAKFIAARAAGCLLKPCVGDRVLCLLDEDPFILSVLERADSSTAEIGLSGNIEVRTTDGSLKLTGERGVDVSSPQEISMVSDALKVANRHTELLTQAAEAIGVQLRASFDDASVLAKTYDLVAERIAQRADRVYRFIGDLDQLRAGRFDHRAERTAQIKGENTVMVAREVVKIDGEQIHVG